jgi:hypothetical protein
MMVKRVGIDAVVLLFVLVIAGWALFEFACAVGRRLARGAANPGDGQARRLERGLSGAGHWQSDLEELPAWADPAAPRDGCYGPNSGSTGMDYSQVPARPVRYYSAEDVERRSVTDPDTAWLDPVTVYGLLAGRIAAEPDLHRDAPTDPAAFDAWLAGLVGKWQREQNRNSRDYSAGLEP